jgi:ribonuclease HII
MPPRRKKAQSASEPELALAPFVPAAGGDGPSLVLGIDEAGRGPILGPMVLAAVVLDEAGAEALAVLGVTDSKRFGAGEKAHAARSVLAAEITRRALHVEIIEVSVAQIDARTRLGQLNHLEREVAAELIERAPPVRRVVADGERLFKPLASRFPHLVAEDRAELQHVAVAAASLCAKVRRDEAWLAIRARYAAEFPELCDGYAGGGYMNEATRRFLRAYCARYGAMPPEGRTSWPWDFCADLLVPAAQLALGV